MTDTLDPVPYLRLPRLDVASAVSLGKMMLAVTPKDAPVHVKKAAKRVHACVTALEDAWKQRVPASSTADLRPLDRRLDNRWSALHDRITAWEALDEREQKRARASEIAKVLFPDGLAFLKLAYVSEHAESQRRLDLVAERKLGPAIDDLAGKEFLAALRDAHAAYGEALGITKAAPFVEAAPAVNAPLRALTEAIGAYNVQVLAYADHDDGARTAARRALEPVDKFRQAQVRHGGAGVPADAPPAGAPTPEPPLVPTL